MSKATLLFAQQGIKAVTLTDECISIHYVDGSSPLFINDDDVCFEKYHREFSGHVKNKIAKPVEEDSTEQKELDV